MIRKLILVLALFTTVHSQTLRIDVAGELKDDSTKSKLQFFKTQAILTADKPLEIFCGPQTIKLSMDDPESGKYAINAEIFGLGPEYFNAEYKVNLALSDTIPLPPIPVRGTISALYKIAIIDDTTQIQSSEPANDDTTAWGVSESIHYRTHWLRGSFADYNWNIWMSYLELVYDRYRYSYSLSSSEKIDIYFHPESEMASQTNPPGYFAIFPRNMRIDAVFGHDINSITPQPAAELLIYRLWGYGPRWMNIGFSRYYSDDHLQMRYIARNIKADRLAKLLSNSQWLEGDTSQVIVSSFCRYLADTYPIAKFMELYRDATDIDFVSRFAKVYKIEFSEAISEFLEFSKKYVPQKDELEYYASIYMRQGEYAKAAEYLKEDKRHIDLSLCLFWLGDYGGAAHEMGVADKSSDDCPQNVGLANYRLAAGEYLLQSNLDKNKPLCFFRSLIRDCKQASVQLGTMCLDDGKIADADSTLKSVKDNDINSPDYFIEAGRLRLYRGEDADSLLKIAAAFALDQISSQPQEPISYLYAGQAFMYLGDYNRAEENLNTALFLEKRPYYTGCILLELGRLMDLQGRRDDALDFYNQSESIKAGAYQKYLAKKYKAQPFAMKPEGN